MSIGGISITQVMNYEMQLHTEVANDPGQDSKYISSTT